MNAQHGRTLLAIVGWWNIAFAVLHIGIIVWGPTGYRFFGAGEAMARAAETGQLRPDVITLGLTMVFLVFGLYALSTARRFRKLPGAKYAVLVVGILYLLRGILVGPQTWWAFRYPHQVPPRFILFSGVALMIGIVCLGGLTLIWRESE